MSKPLNRVLGALLLVATVGVVSCQGFLADKDVVREQLGLGQAAQHQSAPR